ncbi:HD-GYP domain-containing protein [Exilibacterium tricleocarpae]|nr:HD domain-containing phosphohydrolase [Exilibacterium tricleocarpae]
MEKLRNQTLEVAYSLLEETQFGNPLPSDNTPVRTCIENILTDPDTLDLLARMEKKSPHLRHHALSCLVLCTRFGQYLGITGQSLHNLALGALLHDVGILNTSSNTYDKTACIAAGDRRQSETHVLHGPRILANNPKFWAAIDVANAHHESVNGTGYPRKLKGEAIPYNARIVAIVEAYDTMVSSLTHNRDTDSPAQALSVLYRWMGIKFDQRLVESFIRFLGVYPVGSVVELDSGEVGIVIETKAFHLMMPKIALVLDNKGHKIAPEVIDLYQEKVDLKEGKHRIIKALQNNKYNIDISNIIKKNKYRRDRQP